LYSARAAAGSANFSQPVCSTVTSVWLARPAKVISTWLARSAP
jgi:hypothetical protein